MSLNPNTCITLVCEQSLFISALCAIHAFHGRVTESRIIQPRVQCKTSAGGGGGRENVSERNTSCRLIT